MDDVRLLSVVFIDFHLKTLNMLACKSKVFTEIDITYYLAQYNPSNCNEGCTDEDKEDCFICWMPYSIIEKEFGGIDNDDYTDEEIKEDITVMCEVDFNPLAEYPICRSFRSNVSEDNYKFLDSSKGTCFEGCFEITNQRVFYTETFV